MCVWNIFQIFWTNGGSLYGKSGQCFSLLNWNLKSENCFSPQNMFDKRAFRKKTVQQINCIIIPHFSILKPLNRKIVRKRIKRNKILWIALTDESRFFSDSTDLIFHFKAFNCFVETTFTKFKHFLHWMEVIAQKRQPHSLEVVLVRYRQMLVMKSS